MLFWVSRKLHFYLNPQVVLTKALKSPIGENYPKRIHGRVLLRKCLKLPIHSSGQFSAMWDSRVGSIIPVYWWQIREVKVPLSVSEMERYHRPLPGAQYALTCRVPPTEDLLHSCRYQARAARRHTCRRHADAIERGDSNWSSVFPSFPYLVLSTSSGSSVWRSGREENVSSVFNWYHHSSEQRSTTAWATLLKVKNTLLKGSLSKTSLNTQCSWVFPQPHEVLSAFSTYSILLWL